VPCGNGKLLACLFDSGTFMPPLLLTSGSEVLMFPSLFTYASVYTAITHGLLMQMQ